MAWPAWCTCISKLPQHNSGLHVRLHLDYACIILVLGSHCLSTSALASPCDWLPVQFTPPIGCGGWEGHLSPSSSNISPNPKSRPTSRFALAPVNKTSCAVLGFGKPWCLYKNGFHALLPEGCDGAKRQRRHFVVERQKGMQYAGSTPAQVPGCSVMTKSHAETCRS